MTRYLPILTWGRAYDRSALSNDLMAALIVTIMLIPQSLAYALLAGLPAEAGLYASIVPILLYTVFGTSRALAVGPVAVVSLMTAAALSNIVEQGTMGYAVAALSSGRAVRCYVAGHGAVPPWVHCKLPRFGLGATLTGVLVKTGPVAVVVLTTLAVWAFGLADQGVRIVGDVPQSLPPFTLPFVLSEFAWATPASRLSESPSSGLWNQSRGVSPAPFVNFDAGAETPAAGAFTAIGLAIAAIALTPLIYFLPKATLAATIVVAVLSLVDFSILKRSWAYSKADFAAVLTTIIATLVLGVEVGVSAGVVLSVLLHLYASSKPHIAEVGQVPGTEHFRNILRHEVITDPSIVTLRVDESLYFANARYLEDKIQNRVTGDTHIRHVILQCSAINEIDLSALESLEAINERLREMDVKLHLSEVKGPVMDRLKEQHFLADLTGQVFLSQYNAAKALAQETQPNQTANAAS
ncbi:putative sulfate transporter 4.2 [Nymphon striatum]|nr:putative sulfate transporter 4.2 [Nymphon striatum]